MTPEELRVRTQRAALLVIRLAEKLPHNSVADVITRQLIRSATSVAANYRAVCRARSRRDFMNKLGVVVEEADESLYWLKLLIESHLCPHDVVGPLVDQYSELLRIFSAARTTARKRAQPDPNHQS